MVEMIVAAIPLIIFCFVIILITKYVIRRIDSRNSKKRRERLDRWKY